MSATLEIVAIPPSARPTRVEVEAQSVMSDALGLRRLAEEEIAVAAESLAVLGDPVWVRRGPATYRGSAGRRALTNGEGRVIASDARGLTCGELLDDGELVSVVPSARTRHGCFANLPSSVPGAPIVRGRLLSQPGRGLPGDAEQRCPRR
ncbi:MAG: hypothetical protein M0Z91_11945 [Actinomycetota bacterium]|nr:hypothetical protein [Actinomycetota bacterium]